MSDLQRRRALADKNKTWLIDYILRLEQIIHEQAKGDQ